MYSVWNVLGTFVVDGGFEQGSQHPYLQCLGRLSPLPSVGQWNEFQPSRWVLIPTDWLWWRMLAAIRQGLGESITPQVGCHQGVIGWPEWTLAIHYAWWQHYKHYYCIIIINQLASTECPQNSAKSINSAQSHAIDGKLWSLNTTETHTR